MDDKIDEGSMKFDPMARRTKKSETRDNEEVE
jgi:hypothetical protein